MVQLVARDLAKVELAGSSPVYRSQMIIRKEDENLLFFYFFGVIIHNKKVVNCVGLFLLKLKNIGFIYLLYGYLVIIFNIIWFR